MRVFFILALLLPVAFAVNMKPSLEALTELLEAAEQRPAELAEELRNSPMAAIVPTLRPLEEIDTAYEIDPNALPVVVAHGMGDSCFNSGMNSITALIGTHVKAYSVCVPTGDNQMSDTINGFLMNMDKSVDVFAQKIQADANLKNGFNAVGFSQGNALIRGYIHKYNNPPVNVFLSVHGTINGVSSFPQCDPNGLLAGICRPFAQLLGGLAYNSLVQGVLFQAGYFRDPTQYNSQAYLTYSQMAQWNNEGAVTQKYKDNFLKTSKLVMVKALQDHMVFPNEAEWWGSFAPGGFDTIIPMNETRTYKEDLFGLQTAHTSGRLFFETTPGDHLDFTEEQLLAWLDKYF